MNYHHLSNSEKILLSCPTSDYKSYCQDKWLEHISKIEYPVDILIVENSKTSQNAFNLKGRGFNVIYQKPFNALNQTLSTCLNIIRDYAIKNEYDYLFSLESDQFPPLNVLDLLLPHDKAVIGLPYFHFEDDKTKILQNTYINLGGEEFGNFTSLEESFCKMRGDLIVSKQNGIGCHLINIDVLKKIKFRGGEVGEYGYFAEGFPDYYFHLDLQRCNIPVYLCTDAVSTHYNSIKRWNKILEKEKIR
jgi:hypothetical protein